jgi:serine/threonine protein kinase
MKTKKNMKTKTKNSINKKTHKSKFKLLNTSFINSNYSNFSHHRYHDKKSDSFKYHYTPKLKGGDSAPKLKGGDSAPKLKGGDSAPKLKGGKFLDKGGFGCVITPAIPCSRSDRNLDKSISKIIKTQSDTINKEIKLNSILNKIDNKHMFYVTIDKYCFIDEIPSNRSDLVNVKYKDEQLKTYNINNNALIDKYGKKKNIDKHICDVDLDLKPINLIMPYAGVSLTSVMKTDIKTDSIRGKMHSMFVQNLKHYFKHLIIGLIKMHNNRIVNKDIKQRNIMLQLLSKNDDGNMKNNPNSVNYSDIMNIRYIDFGLSEILTNEFCENINNIELKGTPYYLSPELFVCVFMLKYKDRSESFQKNKIMYYITKHVEAALQQIDEKQIISKLALTIDTLYKKIKYLNEKNRLLLEYFGSDKNKFNGYLQKADVYALGLSIYETLYKYSKINIKKNDEYKVLYDLLSHMIEIDPDKRYNIVQCLSHSYFTGK